MGINAKMYGIRRMTEAPCLNLRSTDGITPVNDSFVVPGFLQCYLRRAYGASESRTTRPSQPRKTCQFVTLENSEHYIYLQSELFSSVQFIF